MVSGWDKNPGPDNDYASAPLAPHERVKFRLFMIVLAIVAGIVYWRVWTQ